MSDSKTDGDNVERTVPLLIVAEMPASLRYYVDGLGFTVTDRWIPDGRVRWCRLQLGGAALMLQERADDRVEQTDPAAPPAPGGGVSIYFVCRDAVALYRDFVARGIPAGRPFVGNRMWVTSLNDPDGYRIHFESPTDVAEETEYTD